SIGLRLIDLVELATIAEVGSLRVLPVAKHIVQLEQGYVREKRQIFGIRMFRVQGPVEVLGGDLLSNWRVEELQVGLGDVFGAMLLGVAIDDRDRRFSQNAERRNDDVEFAFLQFVERQQ